MTTYETTDSAVTGMDPNGPSNAGVSLTHRVVDLAAALGARVGRRSGLRAGRQSRLARQVQAELGSIRTYSDFVRNNPDMPQEHRRRCLDQVASSCAFVDHALETLLRDAPGDDHNAAA